MKIKYFIFSYLLINITLLAQSGFKIGFNFSNYYGSQANSGGSAHDLFLGSNFGYYKDWKIFNNFDHHYYFSAGLETYISVKGSTIRNEVMYTEQYPPEIIDVIDREKYAYYLELPHLIKFHYSINENLEAQIYTGGYLSLLTVGVFKTLKKNISNYSFSRTFTFVAPAFLDSPTPIFLDYGIVLGMGLTFNRFLFDVRYEKGLLKIYDYKNIYMKTISLSLGYTFWN